MALSSKLLSKDETEILHMHEHIKRLIPNFALSALLIAAAIAGFVFLPAGWRPASTIAILVLLDVNDEVAVVEEHPAGVAQALGVHGPKPHSLVERPLHLVNERAHLPVAGAGHDEEDLGQREPLRHVDGEDARRLELMGGLRRDPRALQRFFRNGQYLP